MSPLKKLEAEKLRKTVEAETEDEEEQQRRLSAIVLVSIMNRIRDEAKRKRISKHEEEEEEEEEEDYFIRDEAKRKRISKHEEEEEEEEEDYLVRKQQKQKHKQRKQSVQRRSNPTVEVASSSELEPPPDMPEAFKNVIEGMGGSEIKLVFQKSIETTDVTKHYNRLPMSLKKVRNKFLSEAEEEELALLQASREGMNVTLIEPCLNVSQIQLGKWKIGGSMSYVLKKQWNQVVENNKDLLKKPVVQVWSFRAGEDARLGFALIKVRDGEDVN